MEQLQKKSESDENIKIILEAIDALVDGRFELNKKSLALKWKGSSNQRVIDMVKTRREGVVCLYSMEVENDEIPPNW